MNSLSVILKKLSAFKNSPPLRAGAIATGYIFS